MANDQNKGKVIFVSAGTGDPELVTVKATRFLRTADIVLTDRLVSADILKEYVPANAKVIQVGKQYNKEASVSQLSINQLLVQYALEGKIVVRLKGGDVSIFSNILDELQSLVDNNISYEIIPGITAALGAAAYTGIPLTARDHATSVRFLTYYKTDIVTEEYWKELANTKDTLVFYMSSSTLDKVVEKLISHKVDAEKLLAIVEQATTPMQHVTVVSLYDYAQKLKGQSFASPTLVIIGKVVALHEKFAWLQNNKSEQNYFNPITENIQP